MMESEEQYLQKLERAKKRVQELKGFFKHVRGFIIVNVLLLLLRGGILNFITVNGEPLDDSVLRWVDLNFILTPVLWGIGLLIHGIYVYRYKFSFLKSWEEEQIKKYMEEDQHNADKYK
ncbi:MAG: 2TM domain-containing protein [Flavobacteriaceae bacterium]